MVYEDGWGHCFSCKQNVKVSSEETQIPTKSKSKVPLVNNGSFRDLVKRGIHEETCKKFGYKVGEHQGKTVQIAPYYDDNKQVIGQKIRAPGKEFFVTGTLDNQLFGKKLWPNKGKRIVVTEGELDCMSYAQVTSNWPVVSVPSGAAGAAKAIQKNIQFLEGYEEVVFLFDNDGPGRIAALECANLITPGKGKIATIPDPYKDANDLLLAGEIGTLKNCVYNASVEGPDDVVGVMDVWEEAIKRPSWGIAWPWPSLTALTYGIRRKELYFLGAGVGIGKTDWALELQSHLVNVMGLKVGCFMLEQPVGRTLKTIAGKFAHKAFHKPDAEYEDQELQDAIKNLDGKVFLFNHRGVTDWDYIKLRIRHMVVAEGIKDIILDNLTVMVAHLPSSEANDEINRIGKELASMVQELDFTVYAFSHLNPPKKGEPHERGGEVHESQFTGSRGLMRFGHYLFGLQRNKSPDIPEEQRNTTIFVLLKDREFGNVGRFSIFYDKDKGTYLEPQPGQLKYDPLAPEDDFPDDEEDEDF